ncbi:MULTISPECIES: helix-turn-helix transcriptional regulator [Terrabacteria group]|uniref:helix-turn-helix domain-containing protein n=1 Tax=Bacillati TaxID=1783272 RepID=UPI001C6EA08C|nr:MULTISPECIES: helix-turn-helix transcriptional regulator [Terrabacteria group]MBW9212826.1 helix-turn-helix transcriptional regulator [Trueperella sp. zg.1013]
MNTQELKGLLVAKGYTYSDISNKLGISLTAFTRKMNGVTQFKQDEIKNISSILNLSDSQIILVFFNNSVLNDTI